MFTNLFKRLLTSANVHLLFWAYKLMMCLGKLSVQTESIVKCNCNYFNCTVKGHICVCVCVWLCVCVCFSLLQQQNKPQREVPLATKVLKQEQTKVRMVIIWVWRQRPKTPITKRTHTRKQLATCLANTLKAESRAHTHTHKHKSTHNWHTTILIQHTFGGLMLEMTTKASGWVGRKGGWVAVAHLPPPLLLLATRLSLSLCPPPGDFYCLFSLWPRPPDPLSRLWHTGRRSFETEPWYLGKKHLRYPHHLSSALVNRIALIPLCVCEWVFFHIFFFLRPQQQIFMCLPFIFALCFGSRSRACEGIPGQGRGRKLDPRTHLQPVAPLTHSLSLSLSISGLSLNQLMF